MRQPVDGRYDFAGIRNLHRAAARNERVLHVHNEQRGTARLSDFELLRRHPAFPLKPPSIFRNLYFVHVLLRDWLSPTGCALVR
ncbi:hypothetical protein D3C81_933200 [compost metagenome]